VKGKLRRRLAAALLGLAAVAVAVPMVASSADAAPAMMPTGIGTDCLHPPDPASPESGVSAWIDPGPEKPLDGDPFAKDAKVSIYDVYGYAGTTMVRYDDGCASSFNLWNDLANFGQGVSAVMIALTVRLFRTVMSPSFGSIFDPIQRAAQDVLGNGFFLTFVFITLGLAALHIARRHHDADVRGATTMAGRIIMVLAIGIVCTLYPLTIGATVDKGLGQAVSAAASLSVGGADEKPPADMLGGAAVQAINYNTWLQGTFGTGTLNERAAKEFGPRLFKAAAYTRTEQATINKDPSKAQAMGDLKREHYKEVAKEIEDKYPDVYEWVAGNHQAQQFGYSVAGVVSAFVCVAFLAFALFRLAYAMIVVRIGIGVGPLVALFGVHPKMYHAVGALASTVGEALRSAFFFGIASVLFLVVAIGTILSPSSALHPIVKIFAVLALTYALLRAAKVFGVELVKHKQKVEQADQKSKDESDAKHSENDPLRPSTDGTPNTSEPVDVGFVRATPRPAPTRPLPVPPALPMPQGAPGAFAAIGGAAARTAATSTARGATAGAARGFVKGAAIATATGGTGVGAIATSTAKGAATGGSRGALGGTARGALVAGSAARTNPTPKAVAGTVIYHPQAGARRPSAGAGPSGRPMTGRTVAAARVYNIYKAGAK